MNIVLTCFGNNGFIHLRREDAYADDGGAAVSRVFFLLELFWVNPGNVYRSLDIWPLHDIVKTNIVRCIVHTQEAGRRVVCGSINGQ